MPGGALTIQEKSALLFNVGTLVEDLASSPDWLPQHGAHRLVTGLGRIASACCSRLQRCGRFGSFPEVTQGHMAMLHKEKKRCIHTNVGW
jgi:hypothetical protein